VVVLVRARDAVGKRIVAVEQQRTRDTAGQVVWHVDALVLEDGTRLLTHTCELDGDYAVEISVLKPRAKS
jgi:hypothetical protein